MEKVMKTLQSKLSKANPYYITSPKKVRLFETGRFLNIHPLFYFQIREICTSSTEKGFAMLGDIAGSLEVFFFFTFLILYVLDYNLLLLINNLGLQICRRELEREGLVSSNQSWEEEAGKRA